MKFKFLLLSVVLSLLCSCRTAEVHVEYNEDVDFLNFKTFKWLNSTDSKDKEYTSLKEQRIGSIIQNVLAERGLHFSEKADVLVAVNVVEKEKVYYSQNYHRSPSVWGHYGHWGYHGSWASEPEYYTESTLVIALVDPKDKKALWEGRVKDWHFDRLTKEEMLKLISAMLKHYPPIGGEIVQE
jgi:hypothetical protein